FSVGRPTMKIGRAPGGDLFGGAAFDWDGVDDGAAEVANKIAKPKHLTVERDHVVVVVIGDRAGLDRLRTPGGEVKAIECSFCIIKYEALPVRGPVGCLDGVRHFEDSLPMAGSDVEDLQVAAECHLGVPIGFAFVGYGYANVAKHP